MQVAAPIRLNSAVKSLREGDIIGCVDSVLESLREHPSSNRAAVLPECMLLAKAYCKLGQRAEAQLYLQKAAQLARSEPYYDASTNALLHSIVAELYLMQGDTANAELMYGEFCMQIERLYGTDHAATSDCYNLLAAFYTHQADYSRALEFCGRALVIRIEKLGPNHRCTADSHYNLGLLYRLNGDTREALREFRYARDVRSRLCGGQSLEVAEVDISLGFTEHQIGDLESAHGHYERAFLSRFSLLGPRHSDTVEALGLLNATRQAQRRPPYAIADEGNNRGDEWRLSRLRHRRGSGDEPRRRRRRRHCPAENKLEAFDLLLVRRAIQDVNRPALAKGGSPLIDMHAQAQIECAAQRGPLTSARLRALFGARYPRATYLLLHHLTTSATNATTNESHGELTIGANGSEEKLSIASQSCRTTRANRSLFQGDGSRIRINRHGSIDIMITGRGGGNYDDNPHRRNNRAKVEQGVVDHLGGPGGPGAHPTGVFADNNVPSGLGNISVKELRVAVDYTYASPSPMLDGNTLSTMIGEAVIAAAAHSGSITESQLRETFSDNEAAVSSILNQVRLHRRNHLDGKDEGEDTSNREQILTAQLLQRHPSWVASMSLEEKEMLGVLGDPVFSCPGISGVGGNGGDGEGVVCKDKCGNEDAGNKSRRQQIPLPFDGLVGMPAPDIVANDTDGAMQSGLKTPLENKSGRRVKVVIFSGRELWEAFSPKIKSLGIFPMLIRQRIEEEERKKKVAERGAKRALGDDTALNSEGPNGTGLAHSTRLSGPPPNDQKKDYGPKSGMRQLHWDVLENTEGTIWASAAGNSNLLLSDMLGDLKEEFTTKPRAKKEKDKRNTPKEANLIADQKRRQNFSIFVKTLTKGSRSLGEVAESLLAMDSNAFGANALASFSEFTPQPDEVAAVKAYVSAGGDLQILGPAERFVLATANIPRISVRVSSMRFQLHFDELVAEINTHTETILECCKHVHASKRFGPILSLILKIGNQMNAGTAKGQAVGIKITSLMKLTQTKTNDGLSLLEFLVNKLRERDNLKDLLKLPADFPNIADASKVNFQSMNGDMGKLRKGMREITNALKKAEEDDAHYEKAMAPFLEQAQINFEAMEERFKEMQSNFQGVCTFLGENPKRVAPDEMFTMLQRFLAALSACVRKVEEAAERKRKQAQREVEKAKMKEMIAERRRTAGPKRGVDKSAPPTIIKPVEHHSASSFRPPPKFARSGPPMMSLPEEGVLLRKVVETPPSAPRLEKSDATSPIKQ